MPQLAAANCFPNNAPVFRLIKGDILDHNVDAIVVSTNIDMEVDLMENQRGSRKHRWIKRTYSSNTRGNNNLSTTVEYNRVNYSTGANRLLTGRVRETIRKSLQPVLYSIQQRKLIVY
jgi:hypothetical protein